MCRSEAISTVDRLRISLKDPPSSGMNIYSVCHTSVSREPTLLPTSLLSLRGHSTSFLHHLFFTLGFCPCTLRQRPGYPAQALRAIEAEIRRSEFTRCVGSGFSDGNDIVDLGCGTGKFTREILPFARSEGATLRFWLVPPARVRSLREFYAFCCCPYLSLSLLFGRSVRQSQRECESPS